MNLDFVRDVVPRGKALAVVSIAQNSRASPPFSTIWYTDSIFSIFRGKKPRSQIGCISSRTSFQLGAKAPKLEQSAGTPQTSTLPNEW